MGRGHLTFAAEIAHRVPDALVVGQDDDPVDAVGGRRPAVDMLDHRPSSKVEQWLAGQPGRGVARRDGGDDFQSGHG